MLKNSSETMESPESKQNFDKIINDSLALELQSMEDRNPGRGDVKFRVLKQFISDMANQSFEDAFSKLSEQHKHAVITRMQNQAEHMGGKIPYNFIKILEEKLYGTISDEDGEDVNFEQKVALENQLQSEN